MPSREELKTLVDQLREDQLVHVEMMLRHQVNPPKPRPEFEAMRRRSQEYQQKVLRRFRETQRPGTIGTGGGSGGFGEHEGTRFGRQGFHYWDDKALVYQSMQYLDGREIEVMERLSISEAGGLCCAIELASGGKTVRHSDEFPLAAT